MCDRGADVCMSYRFIGYSVAFAGPEPGWASTKVSVWYISKCDYLYLDAGKCELSLEYGTVFSGQEPGWTSSEVSGQYSQYIIALLLTYLWRQ